MSLIFPNPVNSSPHSISTHISPIKKKKEIMCIFFNQGFQKMFSVTLVSK